MNEEIMQSLKEYASLLDTYQQKLNVDLVMTYDKGYWWCANDKILQKHEISFIQTAKDKELCMSLLAKYKNTKDLPKAISLFGWSKDYEWSGRLLESYVYKNKHHTTNAALRALFPKVVTGKYALNIKTIRTALHSRSLDVKNKILGILTFTPSDTMLSYLSVNDRKCIQSLLKHKDEARITILARILVDRLERNCFLQTATKN